ncbi:nicotinate-nucleotide--dimethylbenzimidazole phosphoribosyltransferase [Dactylosporangium sp. CA-233914]|uniref:nicotinate-nucleotide--dimethylbenzimidazole phosphoribosyltransferase n=1 Tax=Dactylosporangium sp. CA-233914 TaxID=3239934 RepID=UPI003D938824
MLTKRAAVASWSPVDRNREVSRCPWRSSALARPTTALASLGGPEAAVPAGVTLAAAAARVPVVLDGLATSIAALIAVRHEPAAQAALVAGHRSRERFGLEPLLDLRLRAAEGVRACLAARLLLSAVRLRREESGRVT